MRRIECFLHHRLTVIESLGFLGKVFRNGRQPRQRRVLDMLIRMGRMPQFSTGSVVHQFYRMKCNWSLRSDCPVVL